MIPKDYTTRTPESLAKTITAQRLKKDISTALFIYNSQLPLSAYEDWKNRRAKHILKFAALDSGPFKYSDRLRIVKQIQIIAKIYHNEQ